MKRRFSDSTWDTGENYYRAAWLVSERRVVEAVGRRLNALLGRNLMMETVLPGVHRAALKSLRLSGATKENSRSM